MEHIFPECPVCGEKAEEGNGVSLEELPAFIWRCDNCGSHSQGFFMIEDGEVKWIEVQKRMTIRSKLKRIILNIVS